MSVRLIRLAFILLLAGASPAAAQPVETFEAFLARFEAKAVAAGIDRPLYRRITNGMTPDPRVPNLIASQPEFTTPMWDYIEGRVSSARISRGRAAMARNQGLFDAIGQRFGVDPYILGAIWGMETDYGSVLDSNLIRPIIRSLATVAHQRRGRVAEDEAELIAALRLVQERGWTNETLAGSWAGAIGHTQVIASGLLRFGTDGEGDGRVDPHASLADALATTATYLTSLGYRSGQDWGYEVTVPEGFDYLLATREEMRPVSFFADRGVRRVADREFPDPDRPVFLYVPTGKDGPKFLMTANYLVLKSYNFSDSYALSVAHLTDRLKGSGPFVQSWPKATRFPGLDQRIAIQTWLKQLGYYDGEVDGRIGPISQRAYALFQRDRGLVADGFITLQTYEQLQRAVR